MPHIQKSFRHICRDRSVGDIEAGASRLSDAKILAHILVDHGEYMPAGELFQWVIAREEKLLGGDHPDTLFTAFCVATVFRDQGKYDEALKWYRRALTGQEKSLGKDHANTLSTVSLMADVFRDRKSVV